MPTRLYVIERQPEHTLVAVSRELGIRPDDWIVDLGTYPFAVYQLKEDSHYKDITSRLIEPADYFHVSDQWLRRFTAKSGLHDILSIRGYGFWWTLVSRHFEPTRLAFGHIFAEIDVLHAIRQKLTPEMVVIVGHTAPMKVVVRQIFPTATIVEERLIGEGSPVSESIRGPIGMRIVRVLLGVVYFVFRLIWRPDVCIFTPTNSLQTVTVNKKTSLQDIFFGATAQILRSRRWRVTFIDTLVPTTWRHQWARGWFFPSDLIEIAGHRRLLTRGLYRPLRRRWQSRWEAESERIFTYARYRGYDIGALLMPLVRHQFVSIAPSLEIMVSLWRLVFKMWRPKLVYFNHSYGFVALSVIIAAKSLGIATAEQQHGIIAQHHSAYLVPTDLDTRIGFPLCDYMLAWGDHTRRLFVERQIYTSDHVFVCGFPRLDRLIRKSPDRSTTLQALNIPLDVKLVLYSSSALLDGYIYPILNGIKNGPDDDGMYWIIKMHPGQQTRKYWEAAIDDLQLQRVQVVKDEADFYALVAACDLHVSFWSTTFVEAAMWGKPNLGLDHVYCPDPMGLLEAGAYRPVPFEALGLIANKILTDECVKADLIESQQSFAQDWCLYDGQATEHVVTALELIMRQQQFRG